MKLKLDENLPRELSGMLQQLGHDVDTVPEEGIAGSDDDVVWAATVAAGRFFITQDLDFSDIRRFAPGTHPGLLLMRLEHPSRSELTARVEQLFLTENVSDWAGCLVVATEHKVRVRRP